MKRIFSAYGVLIGVLIQAIITDTEHKDDLKLLEPKDIKVFQVPNVF